MPDRPVRRVVDAVADAMIRTGRTLSIAESCTGGLIGEWLTDRPGASTFFLGGVIAYADRVKSEVLGVRAETLRAHGAVSGPTAREMALGVRQLTGADAAVAVTGVAGPGGGSAEKPVGTVWFGIAVDEVVDVGHECFDGDRARIRRQAALAALKRLRRILEERHGAHS